MWTGRQALFAQMLEVNSYIEEVLSSIRLRMRGVIPPLSKCLHGVLLNSAQDRSSWSDS
jgi:hypothetical protein